MIICIHTLFDIGGIVVPLVPAICTQCGAQIEVDNTHEAGICKHCGTAFITEKAINKYTTNIINNNNFAGANINMNIVGELEQLVSAAQGFQRLGEYDKALEIYETIIEKYPQDARGWVGCISTFRNGEIFKGEPSEWWDADFFEEETMSRWFKNACILADVETRVNLENAKMIYADAIQKKWNDFEKSCSLHVLKNFVGNDVYRRERDYDSFEEIYVLNDKLYYHIFSETDYGSDCIVYEILFMDDSRTLHMESCFVDSDYGRRKWEMPLYYFAYTMIVKKNGEKLNKVESVNARKSISFVWSTAKLKQEDYERQKNQNNHNGCYIATCVYGSYDCPEVWTLRRFRDCILDKTWYGRLFIKCYYAISPKLVKKFGNKKWFKMFWRKCLDNMVFKFNQQGIEDTQYIDKY